jgi:mono/diheme cytochrome c family protein
MRSIAALVVTLNVVVAMAACQSARTVESRGQALYAMHCDSCHTIEVHWRDKRLATNWSGLKSQVRRWQDNIGIGLNQDEIASIAGYLNDLYYRYPVTE